MLHLPLLNALKTFVVAGHYLNFTKAAEDLLVSPSAVSHQVRVLEDYLGVKLFIRQKRTLSLTPEGERLHAALDAPFEQIARAIQETLSARDSESLRIALRPFFSGAWLAQHLNEFWGKHPEIQIDLIHTIKLVDFMTENIDLEIAWGKGGWPDLEHQLLLPGNLTPICSARLVEELGWPESPEDLARFTLIHDEDHSAWEAWLDKARAGSVNSLTHLTIDDTNVRLQSILNDQGVMLGCPQLLRKELESGVLVQPFDICLDSYAYYLVYPKNVQLNKNMKIFIDWILQQAKNI